MENSSMVAKGEAAAAALARLGKGLSDPDGQGRGPIDRLQRGEIHVNGGETRTSLPIGQARPAPASRHVAKIDTQALCSPGLQVRETSRQGAPSHWRPARCPGRVSSLLRH